MFLPVGKAPSSIPACCWVITVNPIKLSMKEWRESIRGNYYLIVVLIVSTSEWLLFMVCYFWDWVSVCTPSPQQIFDLAPKERKRRSLKQFSLYFCLYISIYFSLFLRWVIQIFPTQSLSKINNILSNKV